MVVSLWKSLLLCGTSSFRENSAWLPWKQVFGFHTIRTRSVALTWLLFVRSAFPLGDIHAFFEGTPDLAVEVLSPSDRASEVNAKVQDWLASGCQEVWVVDPQTSSITVYSQRAQARVLREVDILACEELLPGFRLPVAKVFLQQ